MSEISFKYIKEEDIPALDYKEMPWDVVVNTTPYQVIKAAGFVHTIGGKLDWGDGNDFWAYPADEQMSFNNLIPFNGIPGARWGIEFYPTHYYKSHWDDTEIRAGRHLVITRNGLPFYDGFMTLHEALAYVLDGKLDEHPAELNNRDFDEHLIGRKVWWRSEPGIITYYCKGQAAVILKPDGIERFTPPKEYEGDGFGGYDDDEGEIKASIFDNHIWWFRS
jgi:hypothetical protein